MNSTRNPSGKVAFLGVMTAAALMLSYIESLFILVPGIPGIKLGFANLAVVLCLYRYGWKEALFLNAVRIALAAFLFGSMFTMLYSLAGAACAFAAMVLAKRLKLFSGGSNLSMSPNISLTHLVYSVDRFSHFIHDNRMLAERAFYCFTPLPHPVPDLPAVPDG